MMEQYMAKEVPLGVGKGTIPRVLGHRGYSGKYMENTITALQEAIYAGADAIETDVHLSADSYVVISHDPETKRVFQDKGRRIEDRNYVGDLDQLKAPNAPYEKLPLLSEVLQLFIDDPAFEGKWLIIDVKADNKIGIIQHIAEVVKATKDDMEFWKSRIMLGIWMVKFLAPCEAYVPEISIVHIGISVTYAKRFLSYPTLVGVSMLLPCLYSTEGHEFVKSMRDAGKVVYVWTVNAPELLRICIAWQFDGILTNETELLIKENSDYLKTLKSSPQSLSPEDAVSTSLNLATKIRLSAQNTFLWIIFPLILRMYE
ncbi:PLC-like phosphodiesterase [Dipodascopsis uninucleata]